MSTNFYQKIKPFIEFKELTFDNHFHLVPDDWSVIITDIKGSTKAVQEGRYKDVNMLGASTIMAIINSLQEYDVPFVFGGDGATVLVPEAALEKVRPLFLGLRHFAETNFQMELRVGMVPVKDLSAQGAKIEVAKYQVAKDNNIAIFRGGGLGVAEKWIKNGSPSGGSYLIAETSASPVTLEGLSCRWQPLKNERGFILTIVAQVRDEHRANEKMILSSILYDIESRLKKAISAYNPVKASNMHQTLQSAGLGREFKYFMRGQTNPFTGFFSFIFWTLFAIFMIKFRGKVPKWDAGAYVDSIPQHADYKKYDDTLRMVLDVSHEEGRVIEEILQTYVDKGLIYFGTAKSDDALMTCMVFSASKNQHLHFIDGGAGGYTSAAKQMKAQISSKF